ncbi:MAG: hypothetical protein K8S21_06330 [Gemmatimonadetes bacterium]|nr:hypothetical protein [Gemmatimonadota bacterium]
MQSSWPPVWFLLALVSLGAPTASAQQLTGTVYRGEPRSPVAGVVLLAESPLGDTVLTRTITGSRGQFTLAVRAGEVRVRALRIGYRPAVLGTFSLAPNESRSVTLLLPENPLVLQAVTLRASSRCDVVGKAGETVASLFDEARKALVATQLRPAEDRPTALVALSNRSTTLTGEPLVDVQHRLISGRSVRPFQAVPLEDIERRGFVVEEDGSLLFRAPDAPVLLSDAFAASHCLQLVEGAGMPAGWIGIGFRPVRITRPLVDVTGTLWMDRTTFELQRLDFEYAGLASGFVRAGLGGAVHFARLPDGSWIESRFELRMPRLRMLPSVRGRAAFPILEGLERTGGEVLSMRVADTLIFQGDSALERRLLAAIGASGGSVAGISFGGIRGTLTDSLRGRAPTRLTGDTIVLREFGLRATTDFTGTFDFKGVPAGRYTLLFQAPWFDGLGLSPLTRGVEVRAGELTETALATPALATYQFLQCGGGLDSLDGVLHGEVTDGEGIPLAGARVVARWRVWTIDGARATPKSIERTDTTGASGTYVLCGVPNDAPFDLSAYPGAAGSEGVTARVGPTGDIGRRDLVLGDPAARVRVRGRVVGPDGAPVRQATVASLLDENAIAAARGDGTFELAVRGRRSQQAWVRALGYEPRLIELNPRVALVELDDIVLRPVAAGLDTVRVTARGDAQDWRPEFDRRRAVGVGGFITETQLQRMPRVTANQIAQFAKRIRVDRGLIKLAYGTGGCLPRWYVDGNDEGTETDNGAGWAQTTLNMAKAIEVYSAAEAPPRYNDFDGCGAIVVWTR